jgi:hypothetical protein
MYGPISGEKGQKQAFLAICGESSKNRRKYAKRMGSGSGKWKVEDCGW